MTEPARILIVDDEELNVDLLQQELEDRGYAVATATNGQEALGAVAAGPPDLILLDVLMPVLDGIETCRRLKAAPETALIPVIIMTALSDVEDRVRGLRAGADDFLSKPVDDRELLARIESALRRKAAVDRTRQELRDATDRLGALGRIDRDATVLVAAADPAVVDAVRAVAGEAGGVELDAAPQPSWVFVADEPGGHVAVAARAAVAAAGAGAAVAIESGSVLVTLQRVDGGAVPGWATAARGPAAEVAASAVWLAAAGQAVAGPDAARRLEAVVPLAPLPGSEAQLLVGEPAPGDGAPTLSWPADFAELVEPLRRAWGVDGPIYLTRSLSGKSGARVYCVDITTSGFSGQAILKLDAGGAETVDHESRRHLRAVDVNPAFAAEHLPRVVHAIAADGRAATLSSIAGGGLEYVLPWAQADYDRQLASARGISRAVLAEWNEGYELSELVGPAALLGEWLGHRLDRERGRIHGFLESRGVDPAAPTFIFEGRWYANPYAFAVGGQRLPGRAALRAVRGMLHGDLNTFNVLLRSTPGGDAYYLIDLEFFEDDGLLLYDNAYFELAHLLHTRESATVSRWMRMLASAQGAAVPTGDDYGLLQIVGAIRAGVHDWIDEREPNRIAYMESQAHLARVAAGLNFVHKRVSDQVRLLALMYAAMNLKSYLRFQAIEWPAAGPTLEV